MYELTCIRYKVVLKYLDLHFLEKKKRRKWISNMLTRITLVMDETHYGPKDNKKRRKWILGKFHMEESKKGYLPLRHGIKLSKSMSPKTHEEVEYMKRNAGRRITWA
ncbi:hypothetical protein GBA52_014082 [Prunus armeniaca]|nr:hypothetical protein GBA52_014082 [Prunus armeniaca]